MVGAQEHDSSEQVDFDTSKRQVKWIVKSLRGGSSSNIDISLTYEKNTIIDIV